MRYTKAKNILLASSLVTAFLFSIPNLGFEQTAFAQDEKAAISASMSLGELEKGIADRLSRVEEFRFIQEEAKKLGVRAWLFGGTAAGYAHYVKWDLQREKGDSRFQKDRFDYDYTNIYRSTQDLDIVVDGNAEQAENLQRALQEKYPHLQGSKSAWEVRLLTQDMGDKQAILNNPDFLNQHTDSNSTGLVEITQPKTGESVVRDVRDWKSKEPFFLKDVYEGKLHFYFSPLHETTKFSKEGRNPPILSAIRYLTKAFQYELELRSEDVAQIKKIIDEYDPRKGTQNSYVANWIEKNGKKLIQNAVNIEYARNTLDRLGLRNKLEQIKNDSHNIETLAWWMNKEPLRTTQIGLGSGETAKELGLDIVAHETNNFLAYESITRAHTGDANVLISRSSGAGELAVHGDGFYTREGRYGARGTGLTIRFHLDPNAREGTDFDYISGHGFVVVKNKAALKVIPESLNVGAVDLFRILDGGESGLGAGDRGILEKLRRRVNAKLSNLTKDEIEKIASIVKKNADQFIGRDWNPVLTTWFSMPVSAQYPEIVESLLKNSYHYENVSEHILTNPAWSGHPEFLLKIIENEGYGFGPSLKSLVKSHWWKNHPELIEALYKQQMIDRRKERRESYRRDEGWAARGDVAKDETLVSILSQPEAKGRPEWVAGLIKKGTVDGSIGWKLLSQPHWKDHPELVEALLENGKAYREIGEYVLPQPFWGRYPKLMLRYLEQNQSKKQPPFKLLALPHWKASPEIFESSEKLIEAWVKKHLIPSPMNAALAHTKKLFSKKPSGFETFHKWRTEVDELELVARVLSGPGWEKHPDWIEALIRKDPSKSSLEIDPAERRSWDDFIKRDADSYDKALQELLAEPHWKNQPELRRLAGGADPTIENLRSAFDRGESVRVSKGSAGKCVVQALEKSL